MNPKLMLRPMQGHRAGVHADGGAHLAILTHSVTNAVREHADAPNLLALLRAFR